MSKKNSGKKSSFWKDFKEFAIKGNMIDLAVGMIIGSAFTAVVTALVGNIFNPLIGLLGNNADLENWTIVLKEGVEAVEGISEAIPAVELKIGAFIMALINFLIMAFVVFLFVRLIAKLRSAGEKLAKKNEAPEEPAAPTTKVCPFCKSEIAIDATRCPHCTSELPKE